MEERRETLHTHEHSDREGCPRRDRHEEHQHVPALLTHSVRVCVSVRVWERESRDGEKLARQREMEMEADLGGEPEVDDSLLPEDLRELRVRQRERPAVCGLRFRV